jgi:hypothetical protein
MFAAKINRLDELEGVIPAKAIEVLRDIFGHATQPLHHRGPITAAAGRGAAGGKAAMHLPAGSDALFQDQALGVTKWAVATAGSQQRTNVLTGNPENWIEARATSDHGGFRLTGPIFEIFMGSSTGTKSQVIPYTQDEHGTRIAAYKGEGAPELRRVELAADLVPTGSPTSVNCYLLEYDAGYAPDVSGTFPGWDITGEMRAKGRVGEVRGAYGYVHHHTDADRWEFVRLEQQAEVVEVTLTEDMAETTPDFASATIDDSYRGYAPDSTGFGVWDPQGLFPRALDTAKGVATYDRASDEYHLVECQQMATMLIGDTASSNSYTGSISLTSLAVAQPADGQMPSPAPTTAVNLLGVPADADTPVLAVWDEDSEGWLGIPRIATTPCT